MFIVLIVLFATASLLIDNYFSTATALESDCEQLVYRDSGYRRYVSAGFWSSGYVRWRHCRHGGRVVGVFLPNARKDSPNWAVGSDCHMACRSVLRRSLCLGIGLINALFIAKMRVASIIVTLGTMSIARGIGQVAALGAAA